MKSNIRNNFDEAFLEEVIHSRFSGDLKEIVENMNDMIITIDFDDFDRLAKGKITNFVSTLVSIDDDSIDYKNVRDINPTDCILVLSGNENLSIGFINHIIKIIEKRFKNINITFGVRVNDSIGDYCKVQGIFASNNEINDEINLSEESDNSLGIRKLLYEICVFFVDKDTVNINSMQQRFGLGFNRAQNILKLLEDLNIISPKIGTTPRKVLIDNLEEIHRKIYNLPSRLISI